MQVPSFCAYWQWVVIA